MKYYLSWGNKIDWFTESKGKTNINPNSYTLAYCC